MKNSKRLKDTFNSIFKKFIRILLKMFIVNNPKIYAPKEQKIRIIIACEQYNNLIFRELNPNDLYIAIFNLLSLKNANNEFFNPIPEIRIVEADIIERKKIKF